MASRKYLGSLYATLGLDTEDWDKSLSRLDRNLRSMGNQFEQFGIRATALISAPIALGLRNSLDKFREFESAFAGIKKTVEVPAGVNEKSFFGAIEREIRDLSKTMPQSAAQLSLIGEMAGQLGVKGKELVPFIKVMAEIGDTTNFSSNEAAIALAKFSNVIGFSRENIRELGNDIVLLGNKSVTFESDIATFATRIGAAGANAGLSAGDIFALSASLSSLGEYAEAGGTSFNKLFRSIVDSVALGGPRLAEFNRIAGVDFRKAVQEDAGMAIVKLLEGLEVLRRKVGTVSPELKSLGIDDERMILSMEKLSKGADVVRTRFELLRDPLRSHNELAEEAAKRYETFDSRMRMVGNQIADVQIGIGSGLAPQISFLSKVLSGLASAFDFLPDSFKNFILYFSELLVIVPAATLAIGAFAKGIGILGLGTAATFLKTIAIVSALATAVPLIADAFQIVGLVASEVFVGIYNVGVKVFNWITEWVTNGINYLNSVARDGINKVREFFGKEPITTELIDIKPFKANLLEVNNSIGQIEEIRKKWAGEGKSMWGSLTSGISKAKDMLSNYGDRQQSIVNDEKEHNKALKEKEKILKKLEEQAQKAAEFLDDKLFDIRKQIQEADIQKSLEDAFKSGNQEALSFWKTQLEKNTREGIERAFLDKGGQFPLSLEESKKIGEIAGMEAGEAWKAMEERFQKESQGGFFDELPNFISRGITNAIVDGFANGFNADTIKEIGKSFSAIFANSAQNALGNFFKDLIGGKLLNAEGGLDLGQIFSAEGGLIKGVSGLAASYGINSLIANLSDNQKDTRGGLISGAIGGAGLGMFAGPLGAVIGAGVGGGLGYLAGTFGSSSNANTNQRHDTINYIEGLLGNQSIGDIFQGNVLEGNNDAFNESPWSINYWERYGQAAGSAFEALGVAFSQMAGQVGPAMGQVGAILAANLNGNLDLARLTLSALDIDAQKLEESFMELGYAGDASWHEVEVYMQSISALTGEGLSGFADLKGSVEQLRGTMGTGKIALEAVRAVLVEIGESGVKSFEEARAAMIAQGVAAEDADRILQALAQRGITNFQNLGEISDREIAGVVADMESLGFQWEDLGNNINDAATDINTLGDKLSDLENKEVDVKIRLNYEENNKPDVLKNSSQFDLASNARSLSGAGSQSKTLPSLSLDEKVSTSSVTINVDARGADAGVERRIQAAILASQRQIIQGSISSIQQMRRRGVL